MVVAAVVTDLRTVVTVIREVERNGRREVMCAIRDIVGSVIRRDCRVRRPRKRAGKGRPKKFPRGTDDVLPDAGYRKPRGMSVSLLPVVGTVELRRVMRLATPTVDYSYTH